MRYAVQEKLLSIGDDFWITDEQGGRAFRIRDTYGVDVAPGQDDVLFLAIAVALDRIHDDDDEERGRQ